MDDISGSSQHVYQIKDRWLCLGLVIMTLLVYWPVFRFDFISYDDPYYVYDNPHVRQGINVATLRWALRGTELGHYHPLTNLSYLIDAQIYGMNPGGFHVTNLMLHMFSVVLLYLFMSRATERRGLSLIVAALFAIHPTRVEPVAWIAERKEVLSAFFGLLALNCWVAYIKKAKNGFYLLTVIFYIASLLSKAIWVTFPCMLLLLDAWPFERIARQSRYMAQKPGQMPTWIFLILEKIPFLIFTITMSMITLKSQGAAGAVVAAHNISLFHRMLNAIVSYKIYLVQTLWPFNLGILYPYPDSLSMLEVGLSVVLIFSISGWVIYHWRKKYLWVGWCWFLGVLVPVIGIVQVGTQAHADRCTYIPIIGLFWALVWQIDALTDRFAAQQSSLKKGLAGLWVVVIIFLGSVSFVQLSYWKDSQRIYEHTLKVTPPNNTIQFNLAEVFRTQGKYEASILHLKKAIEINPEDLEAYNYLGLLYMDMEKFEKAHTCFNRAIEIQPGYAGSYLNLGLLYSRQNQWGQAKTCYEKALDLDPSSPDVLMNMANIYARKLDIPKALSYYDKALNRKPECLECYLNMGALFTYIKDFPKARLCYRSALKLDPQNALALEKIQTLPN